MKNEERGFMLAVAATAILGILAVLLQIAAIGGIFYGGYLILKILAKLAA